jgi:glycosyltransferase involved in cell wall biosynthesis
LKPTHPKKICLFNSSLIWGGGEKWHLETAEKLKKRGFEPIVFSHPDGLLYKKSQSVNIEAVPVKIRNLSFLNPFKLFMLFLKFRQTGAQTVLVGLTCDLKAAALAAKLAGIERVIYRRGTALPLKNNLINRLLYKHLTDTIIVNSLEIKNLLIKHNPKFIDERKIQLIYNEVDIHHTAGILQDGKHPYRNNGEVILGNIGRLVEQKGQKYLIAMARHLKEKNIPFRILIAGSGKLKQQLQEEARRLEVEDRVVFMDFIEDIHAFIRNIDIFVFPSLHEGSSHTLLEVMAACKPVVAFNISSIPEIVEHNKNGLLVEKGDAQGLFRSVEKLIQRKDLQETFGQNGKLKVEKEFNSNQGINKLVKLLNQTP